MFPKDEWENDFKLWVIGSIYCHNSKFKLDQENLNWFKILKLQKKNVVKTHQLV